MTKTDSLARGVLLLLAVLAGAAPEARPEPGGIPWSERTRRFVLLGASIGKGWNLPAFQQRAAMPELSFSFVGVYEFDKSRALDALLLHPENRPDAILLKECASYFPGDPRTQRSLVRRWIDEIRRAGVVPILVTVAPVVAPNGMLDRAKEFVKERVLGRPDRAAQIRETNEWLRDAANRDGLPLLDLEKALRRSDEDRSLDPAFTSGDGLHLNAAGYARLDAALAELLKNRSR